eukprot:Plantae.Rhodophyta-Hildenbrandia_rubra.ctg6494.p1 GENE.Plantae.Rhodophyta-Hildenbrandia_rubra.ctg6494~~Plantae.Rhodophyta-Hildenbrandia_rubra.ctg6494.p1  ORF type:complete len:578 (+),score=142.08 Plantae.Rhodophyta-Hildenbrandia_rubra.ctg6494:99-1832(+)
MDTFLSSDPNATMRIYEQIKADANKLYKDHRFGLADRKYSAALAHLERQFKAMTLREKLRISSKDKEGSNGHVTSESNGNVEMKGKTGGGEKANGGQHVHLNGDGDSEMIMNEDKGKDKDKEDVVTVDVVKKAMAVLLCNRAMTRLRLEQYGVALLDATMAIQYCPSYTKGYYRRGSANFALGKYKDALKDFKIVCGLAPRDRDAVLRRKECDKILKEIAFSEAIDSGKDKVSVADTIDLGVYAVYEAYRGPRVPQDGALSLEFINDLIAAFKAQEKLPTKYVVMIVLAAKKIFDTLPTIVDLSVDEGNKITVCGDTHGQYYDLCNIFDLNGLPSEENPYLFNGDFVDRGSFSVELILTLFAIKAWCPEAIHLTRGNHEACNMNMLYGFEGEVKAKYTQTIYELFAETFRSLPLAYILDGTSSPDGKKAFVLHGGLFSRDGVTLKELRGIDRFREPDNGLMSEMLWSDPQKEKGRGPSKRGTGIAFGPDVTKRFLEENGLDLVVRSHEMKEQGYEVEADGKLITIFSAPNYCDQLGNKGAFITFNSDMKPNFTQFEAVPHPNVPAMAYANRLRLMGI